MVLYELIVTTRCSNPRESTTMIRALAKKCFQEGGNVRNVQILGDRILTKKLMGKDHSKHMIGRFIQILYDGNPAMTQTLQQEALKSFETLRVANFKVEDFAEAAVKFKKPIEEEAHFIKNKNLDVNKYGQALKMLQEKQRVL